MTMPDERMRAIGWGGELLEQIASDGSIERRSSEEARRIAQHYPTTAELEDRVRSGASGLGSELTNALLEAFELFEAVRVAGTGSASTRRHLLFTMRHYPDSRTVRTMSRSLRHWL